MLRRLSLRAKIVAYLVALHLVLGAVALVVLADHRFALLAVEASFLVSIALGAFLVRSFFVPLTMIRTGGELIEERDFSVRFRETGQPEMDRLIGIYNRMIEDLREERLRVHEQRSFLDRLVAASPAGIVTLDFDGKIATLNPRAEALLERPADLLAGRELPELPLPIGKEMAEIAVGGSRILGPHGRRLKCSRAEFFDRGFPRSFFVLEELTEELRVAERGAYEKIIRVLSHEVNNSVGAVSSVLESARDGDGTDRGELRQALDVAIARMGNLSAFMRGFADVVRLPAPDPRPCDLEKLLEDILFLLRPEMERRRIAFSLASTWKEPVVLDKNQIEQVLMNVFRNAVEAIDHGGRIDVSLREERGRACLEVLDTGCGVSPDARQHLFTPFYTTKRDGRGLGLTVVREILTRHRFEFGLLPRPEGGAAFRIVFGGP
jgi:two-component system nitrogen regulation sensor histidine kinase NtrY